MIRIDEIYNHCFWPFVQQNIPDTRLFFCDPFGHTGTENLFNFGHDVFEKNFIFCHDQEPVYPDIHAGLFAEVQRRNLDLNHGHGPQHGAIVVSERDSDIVTQICSRYQWTPYYYFFHGWAALDWFRGYHRTFLSTAPENRHPSRIFFMPNRIVSGRREHRVLLMYHLLRQDIVNGWYSFPQKCPDSGKDIQEIVQAFKFRYSDIGDVFEHAALPWYLPEEQEHLMHSCWLSRFDLVADSEIYVVTETIAQGRRLHLTEKTFKPICQQMPFILVSTAHSLEYLRSYGFRTFGDFWDESYDIETDDFLRLEKIAEVMKTLQNMPEHQRQRLLKSAQSVVDHNYQHFYSGRFEQILWQEFSNMLENLRSDMK
jgi:hypothetical protein